MRQYEAVWIKIKLEGSATIRVTPAFEKTVRKAVKKEKWMDIAWKVIHDDDDYFLEISYDREKCIMHFILCRRIGEL